MLFSLANVATWTYTGYNMIILYAALRSIPTELYEAAAVDGAGPVSTALAHQAPAAAPGAAAVHDLLGHRLVPAVRGAAASSTRSPRRDRQGLHAEPLRLQPGVRRSAPQLRGRPVVPARGSRLRDLVRRHVLVPAGRRRDDERGSHRHGRRAASSRTTRRPARATGKAPGTDKGFVFPTLFMLAFIIYFLMPLWWLFVSVDEVDRRPLQLVRAVVLELQLRRQRQRRRSRRTAASTGSGCATRWCTRSSARSARRCWPPWGATGSRSSRSVARSLLFWIVLGAVMVPTTALAIPLT